MSLGAAENQSLSEDELSLLMQSEGIDVGDEEEEDDFESSFNDDSKNMPGTLPSSSSDQDNEGSDEDDEEEEGGENTESNEDDGETEAKSQQSAAPTQEGPDDITALKARLRNIEGKFGTVNAQMQNMLKAQKDVRSTGGAAPTAQQIQSARQSSKKFEQLRDDFPEWADAMEEELNLRTEALRAQIPQAPNLDGFISRDEAANIASESRKLAVLDFKYPGWEDEVRSNDFRLWFISQNENMKVLADSDDPRDSAVMLDAYFNARNPARNSAELDEKKSVVVNKQKKRLASAISPTKSSAAAGKRFSSEDEDFEEGFHS